MAIEPLYRAHVFATNPKQNPQTTFELEEWRVPGLWEAQQIQIFMPWHLAQRSRQAHQPFIFLRGQMIPFVKTHGGGILSGVMLGDALFYSYGYGSGIHRSQLGRLRMKNGQPERHESEPCVMGDLEVEKEGARIRVRLRSFPRRETVSSLGWIDLPDTSRLRIVDDDGREISLEAVQRQREREGR